MKLRKVALWIGCVLVGGCSFEASCNTGRTLDMKNAEKLVKNAIEVQTGSEPSVTCPGSVKIEKGGRFDCRIEIDGAKGVATLEQKDAKTYVEIVSVTGLVFSKGLESKFGESLSARTGNKVTVDCGARARASTPGESFRCRATDDSGGSADVVVKIKDTAGNIEYELDEASIREGTRPAAEAPPTPPAEPPPPPPTEAPPSE